MSDDKKPADEKADDKKPDDFVPLDKSADVSQQDEDVFADGESPTAPPPASFEVLISMLFTQAMATLGQMPNPATGKPEINKPFAKHYIDTLEMLGEKRKATLTTTNPKCSAKLFTHFEWHTSAPKGKRRPYLAQH